MNGSTISRRCRLLGSRRVLFSAWLLALAGPAALALGADVAKTAENEAAEARLTESVKYLASDDLEGRGVGTKGLDAAAEYLANQFKQLGLKTEIYEGSPYQSFEVTATTELGDKANNTLTLVGPAAKDGETARRVEFKLEEDFTPLAVGGSGKLDAELVFVGYGITSSDPNYDEYAGLDVKGKVVVMLRKEPQQNNPHSEFEGTDPSQHATFQRKVANAFEHEAAAVIMVNDNYELKSKYEAERKRWSANMEKLAELHTAFRKIERPTDEQFNQHLAEVEKLNTQLAEGAKKLQQNQFDRVLHFSEAGTGERKTMPVFFATRAKIDEVIQAALGKDLATIESEIDKELKPQSALLAGWKAQGQAEVKITKANIKNVIGVLEGEGPLAEETVIVGAHYDHLGMGGAGTFAPWTVAIHNGADDNASGTAALVEVARRITSSGQKPKRRIVFIGFSGEERGLLGSAYYVKSPRYPLDATVAMLNMDMVGRLNENKLIVQGCDTAKEFDELIDGLNHSYGFKITKKSGGFGPSDHASFYPHKIPVMHMFTGTHSDYHRPSDDWDKLNIEGMRRVADMVADAALAIANADARPTYQETKRPQVAASGGSRPYLGTIPDFASPIEGYALQGVAPGGPAEKGGMKAGDVIVKFGDSKIGGLEDIDSALRKFKAGDKVKVIVIRDKKETELEVVLDPPK
jgi:acetylornithine deacetylase/succinyl-diaminopimelate desuccinylase-like protein